MTGGRQGSLPPSDTEAAERFRDIGKMVWRLVDQAAFRFRAFPGFVEPDGFFFDDEPDCIFDINFSLSAIASCPSSAMSMSVSSA